QSTTPAGPPPAGGYAAIPLEAGRAWVPAGETAPGVEPAVPRPTRKRLPAAASAQTPTAPTIDAAGAATRCTKRYKGLNSSVPFCPLSLWERVRVRGCAA